MAFSRRLEAETLKKMIGIYCREVHDNRGKEPCDECAQLLHYALQRIDHCFYGEQKPVCSACPVHCYQPEMRDRIKAVMRYAGPKMIFISPLLSVRYMFRKKFKSKVQ